jgi:hypothetical protein
MTNRNGKTPIAEEQVREILDALLADDKDITAWAGQPWPRAAHAGCECGCIPPRQ